MRGTRNTSQRMKSLMRHTERMVLHCSEFKVQDLRICKQYKLMQYVMISFITVMAIEIIILLSFFHLVEKINIIEKRHQGGATHVHKQENYREGST